MHTHSMRDRKQQKNIYLNYLWGHSIGIIFFILYKLYYLSPYPSQENLDFYFLKKVILYDLQACFLMGT